MESQGQQTVGIRPGVVDTGLPKEPSEQNKPGNIDGLFIG